MTVTYLEDFVAGQRFSSGRMAVEREHIERLIGSPIVALGSDAPRQGIDVKASFEAGIEAHLGLIMTMLDTAMALAAQTTLSLGEICPSHETNVKFVRPISIDSGVLHIIGHVVSRGRTVITLEGRIEDTQGRLHAHGTSTCLVMRRKP